MRALVAIVGLLLVVAIAWVGNEMRYRNCVEAAVASTPPTRPPPPFGSGEWGTVPPPGDQPRARAVARCKRLAF